MLELRDFPDHRAVWRLPLGDLAELVVDLATGEPTFRQIDLVLAGSGRHLRLLREHRRASAAADGFGPGWLLCAGPGFEVDASGDPVTVTDGLGRTVTLHRDGDGMVAKVVDPAGGQAAAFAYDASGRMARQTGADGPVTAYGWDDRGRLLSVTAGGETVRLGYDDRNAVLEVAWDGPDGQVRTGFARSPGRTVVTGATGLPTTYEFDDQGRPTSVTDPLGHVTRREWDADGRPTAVVDATGATTAFEHDAAGRPVALRLPTSARSTIAYDDAAHPGLATALRDPAGNELLLEYDASGHLVRSHAPGRAADLDTRVNHPVHGRPTAFTDGNGRTTTFGYDGQGNLTDVTPPAPLGRTSYRHDRLSRVVGVTDGAGRRTGYRHDPTGRLAEVTDEESGRVLLTLAHDAFGRVVRKSSPDWSYEFRWVRTAAGGRLASAVRTEGADTEEVRAGHDAEGALTTLTTAGGTTRYDYDPAGRPVAVTTPAGRTARLTHDAAGRLTAVDFGAGRQEIGYDDAGRRTALTVRGPAGDLLVGAEYRYGTADGSDGDVLLSTTVDGETVTFAYDGLKRLVRAGDTEFEYDGAHHLVRLGGTRFTLNTAGQVVLLGETGFAYDGAGNFTEETNPTGSFTYSATNQTLTGVFGGQQVVDIRYDGLGQELPRRITETTVDGHTVTHVLTHTPLGIARATDDGVPTDFVRTPDGALLAVLTADGRHYWAVTDQQGSVLALLDEEGRLAARYRYTPHGAVTATGEAAAANPFRYRGAYQLLRSAHVLDHHLYNGFWGRFTQPDPTGRQYAPYTFSDNDPVNSGTWTRHDFRAVLVRPFEPAAGSFFPRPAPAAPADRLLTDLTGPGATPDVPPLITGAPPARFAAY
ncbi:DUF6531 domain-containing protein [Kitasatospora sp. NPDC057904]|uniref:DUF6531 domain-containing protein n=1 Tax=Kitasatospora sp. NPDC057904 TaxID=3346275 RepID=UPI0036DE339A